MTVPKKTKKIVSERAEKRMDSSEFDQILLEGFVERIERTVANALDSRKEILAHEILDRVAAMRANAGSQEPPTVTAEWQKIESLSALRGLVGGRFQNLKEKWIQAGFPLREHRGDKVGKYSVNTVGWIDLSNWILKQGFETRLVSDDPECLFELRSLPAEK